MEIFRVTLSPEEARFYKRLAGQMQKTPEEIMEQVLLDFAANVARIATERAGEAAQ